MDGYVPNMRMEVAMRRESAVASPSSKLVIELDIAGLQFYSSSFSECERNVRILDKFAKTYF